MLKFSKKIADRINKKRPEGFEFKKELEQYIPSKGKVLEIGSNLRPVVNRKIHAGIALYGLDPDPTIDMEEALKVFDNFYKLPIEEFIIDEKFDLIILDTVMEHLPDNEETFRRLQKLLNVGGIIISNQPSSLHPFSILNRVLSHKLKQWVLKAFRPWSNPGVITGWKSYYNRCNIWAVKKLAKKNGLSVKAYKCNYNQSDYFAFFLPLFISVVIYEELIRFLGIEVLCSDFYYVLKKD